MVSEYVASKHVLNVDEHQEDRVQDAQQDEDSENGPRQPPWERREVVQELLDEDLHPLGEVQKTLQNGRMNWNRRRDYVEPKPVRK